MASSLCQNKGPRAVGQLDVQTLTESCPASTMKHNAANKGMKDDAAKKNDKSSPSLVPSPLFQGKVW